MNKRVSNGAWRPFCSNVVRRGRWKERGVCVSMGGRVVYVYGKKKKCLCRRSAGRKMNEEEECDIKRSDYSVSSIMITMCCVSEY